MDHKKKREPEELDKLQDEPSADKLLPEGWDRYSVDYLKGHKIVIIN